MHEIEWRAVLVAKHAQEILWKLPGRFCRKFRCWKPPAGSETQKAFTAFGLYQDTIIPTNSAEYYQCVQWNVHGGRHCQRSLGVRGLNPQFGAWGHSVQVIQVMRKGQFMSAHIHNKNGCSEQKRLLNKFEEAEKPDMISSILSDANFDQHQNVKRRNGRLLCADNSDVPYIKHTLLCWFYGWCEDLGNACM